MLPGSGTPESISFTDNQAGTPSDAKTFEHVGGKVAKTGHEQSRGMTGVTGR